MNRQRIVAIAPSAVGAVVAVALLAPLARRVPGGNSDGATVILEGRSIASGHFLLSGWMLSLDSFWTIDACFNAVGVWIVGVQPELLHAVPVAIAVCVVVFAVAVVARGFDGTARALAIVIAFVLLGLPSRALAIFYLQGPFHVGTALYCLIAYVALANGRIDWRWAVGVTFLAAAILGDFQALPLGVLPVAAGGIVDARRERRLLSGTPLLGAAVASVVGALVLRTVARAAGGFRPTTANPLASHGQILRNASHLPSDLLALFGIKSGTFGPSGVPLGLEVLHVVAAGLIVTAVILGWRRIALDLSGTAQPRAPELARFEGLLVLGVIGDLGAFIFLAITSSDAYARYLTTGVIFGVLLAARLVGSWANGKSGRALWRPCALTGVIAAVAIASYPLAVSGRGPKAPQIQVATYLLHAGLTEGIGDYWSSSIVTVETHGTVAVRPVVSAGGRLVRYDKQSAASWYSGVPFTFYVYDTSLIWNGDDRAVAMASFGRPARTVALGRYRILVWSRPFAVGPVGSEGS